MNVLRIMFLSQTCITTYINVIFWNDDIELKKVELTVVVVVAVSDVIDDVVVVMFAVVLVLILVLSFGINSPRIIHKCIPALQINVCISNSVFRNSFY